MLVICLLDRPLYYSYKCLKISRVWVLISFIFSRVFVVEKILIFFFLNFSNQYFSKKDKNMILMTYIFIIQSLWQVWESSKSQKKKVAFLRSYNRMSNDRPEMVCYFGFLVYVIENIINNNIKKKNMMTKTNSLSLSKFN